MQRKSFSEMECGIARALDRIGDPWSFLILRNAMFGTRTFEVFQRRLGIPRNTLTVRLNRLVEEGLLTRSPDPKDGRRVFYRLTPCGEDLVAVLVALAQWGNKWVFGEGRAPSFVADRKSRKPVRALEVASETGEALSLSDVMMIPGPRAPEEMAAAFRRQFGPAEPEGGTEPG